MTMAINTATGTAKVTNTVANIVPMAVHELMILSAHMLLWISLIREFEELNLQIFHPKIVNL